jgi:sialate O-acetylesterase
MVLQRDMGVPVWGKAMPGEKVIVCFDSQTKHAVADAQGQWSIRLDPMPASGTSCEMRVQGSGTSEPLVFSDILVGEVWFCSGQSNMYMPVGPIDYATSGVMNSAEEISRANYRSIRLNSDPEHPLCGAGWRVCSSESVKGFSATAFFFGRMLQQRLDVPVGLINRSRGGSPIQQWTPEAAAMTVPITRKYNDIFSRNRDVIERYNLAFNGYVRDLQAWQRDHKGAAPVAPQELSVDLMNSRLFAGTGGLYRRFVEPVVPFSIRGIIWYQGEANSQSRDVAEAYQELLTTLITSWRSAWGKDDIPFGFVQLPRWKPGTHWPWTRQSMLQTFLSVPGTGMAVIVDDEEADSLHPTNKELVGTRLANWALSEVYHVKAPWLGPLAIKARPGRNALVVEFRPSDSVPVAAGGRLEGFEIAGEDGTFVPANAVLVDGTIRVSATAVPHPSQVRYGWSEAFSPSLYSTAGVPASPFLLRANKTAE